jgi:hypothetical protein
MSIETSGPEVKFCLTSSVAKDATDASLKPALDAVTRTCSLRPTSLMVVVYFSSVAPEMGKA